MRRDLGGHVDLAALRGIDLEAPGMKMELAADAAGQERLSAAIFGVTDDRMPKRGHMRAQLVGPPGEGLQFNPRGTVSGAVEHPPPSPRGQAVLRIDVHFLAAGHRLLS